MRFISKSQESHNKAKIVEIKTKSILHPHQIANNCKCYCQNKRKKHPSHKNFHNATPLSAAVEYFH